MAYAEWRSGGEATDLPASPEPDLADVA
jgi:hypothetical protein